ncbi:hypothetical protein DEU56DRAFT_906175 [Suillus clintonianus]|uniref:uncharacterized protein n=1 Tax=Suillus clintonianus TaxID=1904413 RepID=UPI001B871E6E|nr:uncharacterized protein DEU56DRAFT_906175 [Suillus clintonianus]KAG2157541.1 hypothetical protein DEU56DRAFT_906175 [Suillus clintonianus]
MSQDNPLLVIPDIAKKLLLPDIKLSVLDLLSFKFPKISVLNKTFPSTSFFSPALPNLNDHFTRLQDMPVLAAPVVRMLAEDTLQHLSNRAQSIQCPHVAGSIERQLPIWVLSYWLQIWKMHDKEETHELIGKVMDALAILPWAGNIKGFESEGPIYELVRYTTNDWLTDVHESQMLDLLRKKVHQTPGGFKIEIKNTYFYGLVLSSAEGDETGR